MKLIFALIVALMVNMVIGGKSCVDFGFQCGTTKDQCGNTVDCGSCSGSERCVMNKCVPCTNLCLLQSTTCSTTIKGTIVTPDGVNPVAGMFVYVPNGVLGPKTQGAFCGSGCSDLTGDPLPGVWATTGSDGTFVINDMPSGNIDLVVANLLWRRVFKITVTACTSNDLGKLSLPSTQSEGNIPKIAVVTGNQESFECIFRKIGIKDSEFTVPSDPGSVNLYRMNGASIPGSPTYDALLDNLGLMLTYNIIVISCPGNLYPTTLGQLDNIKEFVNAGGKLFATHYGYSYIKGNPPFDSLAKWTSKSYSGSSCTIPSATPNQLALADYIALLNPTFARNGNDTIIPSVSDLRNDFSEVYSPAEIYMQTTDNNVPIVFGFDTPLTGTSCGKVIFSDFHTDYSSSTAIFPSQCNSVLSIKDQILQYFTFFLAKYSTDPSSCLSKCIPFTCASIGMACGTVTDGCGGTINCSCPGLLRCNCKDNLCEKIPTETLLTMEEKSKKRAAKTYTLTAKSTSELGSDLLTGTITFYDGKVVIGTTSVTKGVATIDVNSLNVGFHILSAVYSGDSTFLTSTSNILAFGTGDKGDKGDAGDKGSKGDKGDIGEKGIMGEEGEKGEVGLKGDRGKFGVKGVKGERGLRGKRGRGFSRYDSKKLDDYGKREISLEESVAKKDEEILFLKNKQVEEEKDFEIYKENESKLDAKKDEEISFLVKRQTEDESAMDRFKKEIEELEKIIKR